MYEVAITLYRVPKLDTRVEDYKCKNNVRILFLQIISSVLNF